MIMAALTLCPAAINSQNKNSRGDDDKALGLLMSKFMMGELIFGSKVDTDFCKSMTKAKAYSTDSVMTANAKDPIDIKVEMACYYLGKSNICNLCMTFSGVSDKTLRSLNRMAKKEIINDEEAMVTRGNIFVIFNDNEQFCAPFIYFRGTDYIYAKEGDYNDILGNLVINVNAASWSNMVEEISNGTWNAWSKLKYINSRLLAKDISELFFEPENGETDSYITFCTPTKDIMKDVFERLGKRINDSSFYKYSWE